VTKPIDSQFCGFERCEKFKSPMQESCIYNLHEYISLHSWMRVCD